MSADVPRHDTKFKAAFRYRRDGGEPGPRPVERPDCPSVEATARAVREGEETALAVFDACFERIEAVEPEVGAWIHLAPDVGRAMAEAVDAGPKIGVLAGVPVALKDVIDTAGLPTENGTPVCEGRRPEADATVVSRLRAAGAVLPGKAVTTEFAYFHPGKTRNPHDLARTPGGSSSGSAAAVGAGMVPAAIGGQTVGSVIRPASFCGVWGMKPSFGLIPVTGVCEYAHSLDHLGVFAQSARDLALVIDAVSGDDGIDDASVGRASSALFPALDRPIERPRLGFVRTFAWEHLDDGLDELFEEVARELGADEIVMPPLFEATENTHRPIALAEVAFHRADVYAGHRHQLSPILIEAIEAGMEISAEVYIEAQRRAAEMRAELAALLAGFDAVISPCAKGEAPLGIHATGDPIFCMLWTLMGAPAVSIPALSGPNGLPVGLQATGPRRTDEAVLRAASWIGDALGVPAP